jgi:hypothetical protein
MGWGARVMGMVTVVLAASLVPASHLAADRTSSPSITRRAPSIEHPHRTPVCPMKSPCTKIRGEICPIAEECRLVPPKYCLMQHLCKRRSPEHVQRLPPCRDSRIKIGSHGVCPPRHLEGHRGRFR